jgi:hypothetical protein
MKYALLIYSQATAENYDAAMTALRQPGAPRGAWSDYTAAAREAGVFLGAEQLAHDETATSVRSRPGGERLITDGPFMETKEHLLGFYLIEASDLDVALDWAHRMPTREGQTVEVRAVLSGMPWQQVLTE